MIPRYNYIYFKVLFFNLFNSFSPKSPSNLNAVWWTSSEFFGKNTFNFSASLRNYSINSLLSNIVYFVRCIFNYAGSGLCCLINCVSPSICEIITILKSSSLPSYFSAFSLSFSLPLLYMVHIEISSFLVQWQKEPIGCPFLISILPSKDLFNISSHRQCFPWKSSLISSVLNFDVMYPLELLDNKAVTSVSIFSLESLVQ